MRPNGSAENALEQVLWAYALGKAQALREEGVDPTSPAHDPLLQMRELSAVYQLLGGTQPKRDELAKWIQQVGPVIRAMERGDLRVDPTK